MSTVAFDVGAARARFSALESDLAFFDGPGGTQVPDEVIDAIATYLRESNANVSGPYETSRRTERLVADARLAAASFLGSAPDEVIFGANMTTLNFALSRTAAREWNEGDEIVVTRLDHDGNVSPWLELAHDLGLVVRFADIREDTTLDLEDLAAQLTDRTRVVAFPWASNAVGTLVDVARVAELAHQAGALAWVDAVHYGPHGPIDVAAVGVDVLICSPYKFYGPHLGLAYGKSELLERWRPYKVRPASDEPLGFLDGLPDSCTLYGVNSMDRRVSTFAFNVEGQSPRAVAERLGEHNIAVWQGNYYAVEVMKRLGLDEGAVRAGIVHYNTADEVDRLLGELQTF
jgi:cysteine desulfurase family protein (TIGR01976 family)